MRRDSRNFWIERDIRARTNRVRGVTRTDMRRSGLNDGTHSMQRACDTGAAGRRDVDVWRKCADGCAQRLESYLPLTRV